MDADIITTTLLSEQPPPPPLSRRPHEDSSASGQRVRLMCSFGGRILPRPQDQQLRYVGGETRIIAVPRSASFSTLLSKLSKLAGTSIADDQLSVKYQLPNEDLDALISLTSDEDVENMMDEYDRLSASRTPRFRLFLFHVGADPVSTTSGSAFGSILDGSGGSKHDDWFLDALNGSGVGGPLERGRSEASSIVSEVPDYLFGFDNNSDETPPASRQAHPVQPNSFLSDHGPTKQCDDFQVDPPVQQQQQPSYASNPGWHYVAERMPVYYVPRPVMPVQLGYAQPVHGTPVYVDGTPMMAAAYEYPMPAKIMPGNTYEVLGASGLTRNLMAMPVYQPAEFAPAAAELQMQAGSDFKGVGISQ